MTEFQSRKDQAGVETRMVCLGAKATTRKRTSTYLTRQNLVHGIDRVTVTPCNCTVPCGTTQWAPTLGSFYLRTIVIAHGGSGTVTVLLYTSHWHGMAKTDGWRGNPRPPTCLLGRGHSDAIVTVPPSLSPCHNDAILTVTPLALVSLRQSNTPSSRGFPSWALAPRLL